MAPDPLKVRRVQQRLLAWYAAEARDLPWRRTRDPYAILVAEVMLQQTQVDRVIPKWHAWLARFPNWAALAGATRAEAIRAWQGLGYNLRALRLYDVANQIVGASAGVLPCSVDELVALKGIGRYTANAVACFAYEQPVAMVDTNVRRVLSRVFEVEPSSVEDLAASVVPADTAYGWNQGLMDLGATVCRARRPLCLACPLVTECGGPVAQVKPATKVERFDGSRRYYRGRLIETLRALRPGEAMHIDRLVAAVGQATEHAHLKGLVRQLASDGLVDLGAQQTVRLAA
jgi:A/G-specific adenine glycosylase